MPKRILFPCGLFLLAPMAFSDVLLLRSGATVKGELVSADAGELRWKSATGETKSYPLGEISTIAFDARAAAAPAAAVPPVAAAAGVSRLPRGPVVIRTLDAIDSGTAQLGQTFRATLSQALALPGGGQLPRGADAILKLVESRSAGRIAGSAALSVMLVSISSGGQTYEANTENVTVESGGKGKSSAAKVGVGAGAGAILGGALGGRRGAAIGAGAGAGAGTAVAMASGPKVRIPAETLLTFQVP